MIQLYRKRFIPFETVHLKDDEIILMDHSLIITKWNTLKPRNDISHGVSAFFTEDGFKISKIYNVHNEIVYWYCDIIETIYKQEENSIIFEDLLVDVIVYENGFVKVLDMAEIADAVKENLITSDMAMKALRILDDLLTKIYANKFSDYKQIINLAELS